MCGFTGFGLHPRGESSGFAEQHRGMLERMNGTLVHRGPDEEGLYGDGRAAMVMRRLAIQDLSRGQLPIRNEDETVFVVFKRRGLPMLACSTYLPSPASNTEYLLHIHWW